MKRNPREIEQTHRKLSRRALVVGGLQLGFVGALGMRMRYMQVDQADEFRLLAEENRVNIRLIAPSRGELFDRNGIPLARNVPSYRLVMVREDAGDIDTTIANLAKLVDLDPDELNRALDEMRRRPPFLPIGSVGKISAGWRSTPPPCPASPPRSG